MRADRGRWDEARGQRSLVVGEVAVAGSCGGDGRDFRGTARTASNVLSALIARGLQSFRYPDAIGQNPPNGADTVGRTGRAYCIPPHAGVASTYCGVAVLVLRKGRAVFWLLSLEV